MTLPVTITGVSVAVAPVGPFKVALPLAQYVTGGSVSITTNESLYTSQTFLAGISTNVISVTLFMARAGVPVGNISIELRTVTASNPTGTVLGSVTIAASALLNNNYNTFTFSTPIAIDASTTYAIVLNASALTTNNSTNNVQWVGDTVGSYANGRAAKSTNGTTWTFLRTDSGYAIDLSFAVNVDQSDQANYYFFGRDGTTATTLQAYKSTAPDTSWASITTKTAFATGIQYLSACQVGKIIHMVVTDGATTSINHKYQTFDTSTDTFVTAETINSALNTQGSTSANQYNTSVVVRSAGEVVVLYNAARVSTFSQISYRRRTGVATWAAAVAVSATGVNCSNPIVVLGASDRLHFLHFNSTNTIQRHLTSGNVIGTAASTGATALVQDAVTFDDAGTIRHVGLTATSAFRWTSADNPTVTNAAVTFGTPVRGVDDSGNVYALYQSSTDSDLYIKSSTDDGATFGTAVSSLVGTVAAADANLSKNQHAYQRGSDVVFPYIVNDNSTLKYNEAVIRTVASAATKAPPVFQSPRKVFAFSGRAR